jgi:hypothetical protein
MFLRPHLRLPWFIHVARSARCKITSTPVRRPLNTSGNYTIRGNQVELGRGPIRSFLIADGCSQRNHLIVNLLLCHEDLPEVSIDQRIVRNNTGRPSPRPALKSENAIFKRSFNELNSSPSSEHRSSIASAGDWRSAFWRLRHASIIQTNETNQAKELMQRQPHRVWDSRSPSQAVGAGQRQLVYAQLRIATGHAVALSLLRLKLD